MTVKGRLRLRWTTVALVGAVACGDGEQPAAVEVPTVTVFIVALTSPNPSDGAALISITGGVIDKPAAVSQSDRVYFRSTGTSTMMVAVVGTIASGGLVRFEAPIGAQASAYSASLLQVADRNNDLRSSLSGYSLTVSEP